MRPGQYIDWKDKAYVIGYARQLGKGLVVYKDGEHYRICDQRCEESLHIQEVVYRT